MVSRELIFSSDVSGALHIIEIEMNGVNEATRCLACESSYILPTATLHKDKLSNMWKNRKKVTQTSPIKIMLKSQAHAHAHIHTHVSVQTPKCKHTYTLSSNMWQYSVLTSEM
jgi:hypothetical protein